MRYSERTKIKIRIAELNILLSPVIWSIKKAIRKIDINIACVVFLRMKAARQEKNVNNNMKNGIKGWMFKLKMSIVTKGEKVFTRSKTPIRDKNDMNK